MRRLFLLILFICSGCRIFDFSSDVPALLKTPAISTSTFPAYATATLLESEKSAGTPTLQAQKVLARVCIGFPDATLNIRSEPGIEYPSVAAAPEGAHLTLLSTQLDWYQVRYQDITGYVSRYYVCDNDRKDKMK